MPPTAEATKVLYIGSDETEAVTIREHLEQPGKTLFAVDWSTTYQDGQEALEKRCHDVYLIDFPHGHDQSGRVGVSDGHEHVGHAEHLRSACRRPIHTNCGHTPTGDLNVLPPDPAPSGSHRLHHRLFTGKAGGKAPFWSGKPEGVIALVFGEATFGELGILLEHSAHTFDVGQVDAQPEDPHI